MQLQEEVPVIREVVLKDNVFSICLQTKNIQLAELESSLVVAIPRGGNTALLLILSSREEVSFTCLPTE